MEQYINYASTQLMGRCTYNPTTGKADYESFSKYYKDTKQQRTLYRFIPYLHEYGMMCTRTWWSCFKLGFKHVRQGKATFFIIEKDRPKKH